MKKLNRKGFTLIELLAVIVIMAIILVVTLPYILDSVGNAKVNSIHNLAKSSAKSYTDMVAADMIAPTTEKQITSDIAATSSWACIKEGLATKLGISVSDVELDGTGKTPYNGTEDSIKNTTCSSIKLTNGSAEVFLIAKDGGKFADTENFVYAVSSQDAGKEKAKS